MPARQAGVVPLDHRPVKQRSGWESNPDRRHTRTVCGRNTSRPQVLPAGLEPAMIASTSGRCRRRWATGASERRTAKRTEQESNLNEAGARLFQGPMTGAPDRTPTLPKSSGGWVRASGLRVFSAALLPPELHRNEQETLVGVEPTSCDFADRRLASRPQDPSEPAVGLKPTSSALRGRCPARRASPAFWSSQCWCRANSTEVQSLRPLPRAWPEVDPEPAAGLEPARAPLQEGCSACRAALA